jgi:hypothetical protein
MAAGKQLHYFTLEGGQLHRITAQEAEEIWRRNDALPAYHPDEIRFVYTIEATY